MAGELRLVRTAQGPDEGVIETLRELLTQAESGRLRALVIVAEYAGEDSLYYHRAGSFNEFEFAGHCPLLAAWLTEEDD